MRRVRSSEITDLNQLLISIRHTAVARCAIFELDYEPLDYRIAIFDVLLVSDPAFQLLLIGRERA